MLIHEHFLLAPLTTFGIGGPARYFVEAASVKDLRAAITFARESNLPIFVLGGGSNLLVADEGFDGVVIKVALRGIELRPEQTADFSRQISPTSRALGMTNSRIEKGGSPEDSQKFSSTTPPIIPPFANGGRKGGEPAPQETVDSSYPRDLRSSAHFSGAPTQGALGMTVSPDEKHGATNVIITAAAGEDWDTLVAYAINRDLAGFECMSGIPGTVGATPVQNVGAYGQEVSSTITEVEALEIATCELRTFTNAECAFSYRTSLFNTMARGQYIITRVSFELRPSGAPNVEYRDLKNRFGERTPTLAETREAVLEIRSSKGMLIEDLYLTNKGRYPPQQAQNRLSLGTPGGAPAPSSRQEQEERHDEDPHLPNTGRYGAPAIDTANRSAGSFFKNPVLTEEEFIDFERRAAARGLAVPNYPALSSQRKIPAAWLVEQAGFTRGFADGPVGISSKHALAIVNRGGARASDVARLKNRIQGAVFEQFGIELQPEPVFLGFEASAGGKTELPHSRKRALNGPPAKSSDSSKESLSGRPLSGTRPAEGDGR